MPQKIKTFRMFEGRCEEAIDFYVALFPDAAITEVRRYGPGEPGAEGSVKLATSRSRVKCSWRPTAR